MNKKNSKSLKEEQNKVEEPNVVYNSNTVSENQSELHPILIQLLEKSINEIEEGKTFTHEEVLQLTREKYPFLK